MNHLLDITFANPFSFMAVVSLLSIFALMALWLLSEVFYAWRLLLRHISIWKHGWPPAHCDADGELVVTE
jgi:hypothetical protein